LEYNNTGGEEKSGRDLKVNLYVYKKKSDVVIPIIINESRGGTLAVARPPDGPKAFPARTRLGEEKTIN